MPALAHVHLKIGRYNDLIPATIRVVLQTSGSLQSIFIQVDPDDQRFFNRARVEAWGEEDSRITVNHASDYDEWHDWKERVACNI